MIIDMVARCRSNQDQSQTQTQTQTQSRSRSHSQGYCHGQRIYLNRNWHCLIAALLILQLTLQLPTSVAEAQPRLSRRPVAGKVAAVEASSERTAAPDQMALAASRSDGQGRGYQRRGAALHARTKEAATPDYGYGQLELNLVRPEQETSSLSPQAKLNGYYGGGTIEAAGSSKGDGERLTLDDSETAAEYVANAMKLAYGTRHKEPQSPSKQQQQHQFRSVAATQRPYSGTSSTTSSSSSSSSSNSNSNSNGEHLPHKHVQQQHQSEQDQVKVQAQAALLQAQMQAELQAQLLEQHALLLAEQQQRQQQKPHGSSDAPLPSPAPVYEKESSVPRSYEIYENAAQSEPGAGGDIERLYRTKYYSYAPPQPYRSIEAEAEEKVRVSASTEIPKAEIMKQIEKSVIKYMKELEAEGKIITTPQELAPPATKTYYKVLSLPNASSSGISGAASGEEKRYSSSISASSGSSSSTVRPKFSGSLSGSSQSRQPMQSSQQPHGQYHVNSHSHSHAHAQPHPNHHQHQLSSKPNLSHGPQRYQSETETAYQAPDISAESLAPNVEFIYKIKTRAPLQTATVKTVSKPYTLPLKSSAEHFDHGAALKNIEEFDLSHVVTTPERELEQDQQRVTSKPHKLYFNSEIYHDINSLPYKGEKLRGAGGPSGSQLHSLQGSEYRHKLNPSMAGDLHPDYKGYSGYFAEPVSGSMEVSDKQPQQQSRGGGIDGDASDEGYPVPYQYVLKKEPLSSKYEEERESWEQLRLAHGKPVGGYKVAGGNGGSSLEYDSYNPKFNNNPEGYGYQHTYQHKGHRGSSGSGNAGQSPASNAVKRGKRGGGGGGGAGAKKPYRAGNSGGSAVGGKLMKDLEANLALRPPPKN